MSVKKEYSPSRFIKPKEYMVHDNGGRPFKVLIDKHSIKIYTHEFYNKPDKLGNDFGPKNYTKLLKTINSYEGVFIGSDMGRFGLGNSILVHVKDRQYIFIGWNVVQIETKEPIISYVSPIGNSDVPYPYAISNNHYYYMINDNNKYWYVEKNIADNGMKEYKEKLKTVGVKKAFIDPYSYFYGMHKLKYKKSKKHYISEGKLKRPLECKTIKAKVLIKRM